MNLIERLGGYENAKERGKRENVLDDHDFNYIQKALLQHRRVHGIFEVGDKVAWINSIAPNDPRLFEIEENLGEKPDTWSLRHATDEEIKAGKRLEVNQ